MFSSAGLGSHQAHLCLHQPHGAPRGSGALAGGAAGEAPAQTPADHLPDQPGPPQRTYCSFDNDILVDGVLKVFFYTEMFFNYENQNSTNSETTGRNVTFSETHNHAAVRVSIFIPPTREKLMSRIA